MVLNWTVFIQYIQCRANMSLSHSFGRACNPFIISEVFSQLTVEGVRILSYTIGFTSMLLATNQLVFLLRVDVDMPMLVGNGVGRLKRLPSVSCIHNTNRVMMLQLAYGHLAQY